MMKKLITAIVLMTVLTAGMFAAPSKLNTNKCKVYLQFTGPSANDMSKLSVDYYRNLYQADLLEPLQALKAENINVAEYYITNYYGLTKELGYLISYTVVSSIGILYYEFDADGNCTSIRVIDSINNLSLDMVTFTIYY